MKNNQSIQFVFLGNQIPKYVKHSIRLANQFSGMNIDFLGTKSNYSQFNNSNLRYYPLEDFYDDSEFQNIKTKITYSHDFRNGFWLKTLERFFVLEQFMRFKSLDSIFHAELDQLLFRCDHLVNKLENLQKKGIFVPFRNRDLAVASILYCNDYTAIKSFIDFSFDSNDFANEMELLAKWASINPSKAFALPTISTELAKQDSLNKDDLKPFTLSFEAIHGMVDAADIGWWLAGNDPRNLPIRQKPFNKFFDTSKMNSELTSELSTLKLSFESSNGFFLISTKTLQNIAIYNIHIHSKIHRWINRNGKPVSRILKLANNPKKIVIWDSRIIQINYFLKESFYQVKNNPEKIYKTLRRFLDEKHK